ncbi:MAG: hypothetical protein KDJ14_01380 [Xanthomonadales bacterium]|nr:hypothetical protein [Xanthomonadales bacterium]
MDLKGLPSWLAPLTLHWDRVILGSLALRCDVSLERDPDDAQDLRLRCDVKLRPVITGTARGTSAPRRRVVAGARRRE